MRRKYYLRLGQPTWTWWAVSVHIPHTIWCGGRSQQSVIRGWEPLCWYKTAYSVRSPRVRRTTTSVNRVLIKIDVILGQLTEEHVWSPETATHSNLISWIWIFHTWFMYIAICWNDIYLIPKLLDSRFLEEFIKVWEQEFIQVIPARGISYHGLVVSNLPPVHLPSLPVGVWR